MRIKNKLSILAVLGLMSCSVNTPIIDKLSNDIKIVKLNQTSLNNEQSLNIDVGEGKTRASFSIKIDLSNSFKTKANVNGSLGKTPSDVQSYEIYLIKNSNSTYPVNGDPIGDKVLGPYFFNSNGASSTTINFSNIGDSQGQYYYIALRAIDGLNATGNNLIKVNNNWTGTTSSAPYNKQVVVSNSGVTVNSSFVVNPTSTLIITPQLIDGVGAKLDASINVNNGTTASLSFIAVNNTIGEFKVNTYTTNIQSLSDVAMDSSGNFVVTWQSNNQDGSGYGVYAQRYNSSGLAQGSEFKVNTYTTNNQSTPRVAMDSSGNFVVAWTSYNQTSGVSKDDIYAQRYNSSGIAQGSEFKVNTYTTGGQNVSDIAMDSSGNFIVTWRSGDLTLTGQDGSKYGIYAQRYNSSGIAQSSEFKVNTYTTNNQYNSSIAMDSSGNFVITWVSGQDGSGYGIYAQRYNSVGIAQGSEFKVNTYTTGNQYTPSIAMDSTGNFVATWHSSQDGSVYGIYAQRYNSSGIAQGSEFKVNTYTTNTQYGSSVSMDSSGNFVVTWHSAYQDGSQFGVYAQRYNSSGVAQGSEFRVNTYTTGHQHTPSVSVNSSGNFVITWQSGDSTGVWQDGSQFGVYAQRYNSSGNVK